MVWHRTSAAYKRSTNGQAERVVQILQAQITKQNVNVVIAKSLLCYNGRSTRGVTYGETLRTRLDLIVPSVHRHVAKRQNASFEQMLMQN